MLNKPVESTK